MRDQAAALQESVERIRSNHDRTMRHEPTTNVGYCAEPDGISATYCEVGILLRGLAAARSAPPEDGLDVMREIKTLTDARWWIRTHMENCTEVVCDQPHRLLAFIADEIGARAALAAREEAARG